jgi:broad specificity phosphatase PhoE
MSKLLMFRHAQASFMQANYDQLSDLGFQQSSVLGEYLASTGVKMDKIYIGPLVRHHQTFSKVKEAYHKYGIQLPEPIVIQELKEHYAPQILRKIYTELINKHDILQDWHNLGEENAQMEKKYHLKIFHHFTKLWATNQMLIDHPEEYEDWQTFRANVKKALEQIVSENGQGTTVGVFTSGGTISAATGHILEMTNEERIIELNGLVKNTSISEYYFSNHHLTLSAFNTIPHLTDKNLITFV